MRGGKPDSGNTGGVETIEEKSLGAICKSGSMPIDGVLEYGEPIPASGLYALDSPGKRPEIMTGLSAAGANVIVFPPAAAPAGLSHRSGHQSGREPAKVRVMKDHIDLDASGVLSGQTTIDEVGQKVYDSLWPWAAEKKVKAETLKYDQTVEIYTTGPTFECGMGNSDAE